MYEKQKFSPKDMKNQKIGVTYIIIQNHMYVYIYIIVLDFKDLQNTQ